MLLLLSRCILLILLYCIRAIARKWYICRFDSWKCRCQWLLLCLLLTRWIWLWTLWKIEAHLWHILLFCAYSWADTEIWFWLLSSTVISRSWGTKWWLNQIILGCIERPRLSKVKFHTWTIIIWDRVTLNLVWRFIKP